MRIIAGKFRGRSLRGPRGSAIRPTSDRLRETLFDILKPVIAGSVFIDAFAGTGAVGLEAISRGSREAVFVEERREACSLIRQNLILCGVAVGYRLIQRDVFTAMRQLAREQVSADVIFLDPPYDWQPYADLLETIFRLGLAREKAQVVCEHFRKADLPEGGPGYERRRIVRQGDHCLSFYIADCGSRIAD
jgi:16S rRNA (guanine(966)-N(2))-methyltransferase RsmD